MVRMMGVMVPVIVVVVFRVKMPVTPVMIAMVRMGWVVVPSASAVVMPAAMAGVMAAAVVPTMASRCWRLISITVFFVSFAPCSFHCLHNCRSVFYRLIKHRTPRACNKQNKKENAKKEELFAAHCNEFEANIKKQKQKIFINKRHLQTTTDALRSKNEELKMTCKNENNLLIQG